MWNLVFIVRSGLKLWQMIISRVAQRKKDFVKAVANVEKPANAGGGSIRDEGGEGAEMTSSDALRSRDAAEVARSEEVSPTSGLNNIIEFKKVRLLFDIIY